MADRIIAYGGSPEQIIEIRDGGDGAARPLIMIIHGGFWRADIDRTHARPMADAIAAAGWTVGLPEYARVPGRPDLTLADLTALLTYAPRALSHNGRVVLIGHSAGGHLVLWATAAGICAALFGTLALAPVADLALAQQLGLGTGAVMRFLGCDALRRADIDPTQMGDPRSATTLLHGVDDDTVPLSVSESYVAAHPKTRLLALAGCGHYDLIDPKAAAWSSVMAQLAQWRS